MTRLCPTCSRPLPSGTRSRFCPRCSLRGALELTEEEAIPPLESGRVIGDYQMLELLGRGGMGVVYRARQRSLNRLVAVKVLVAGEFADSEARRRFQAEAAAAARLRHPNIVAIYEIGEHEGQPFFSMELVEGRTFADLVRDGPIPPVTAARLLQPVAEAIHFAHTQGVLHRDLKPSNLLLDGFGLPRVSDFGLARRLDAAERFTLTGEVLGSPSYLAPEQARGDRAREGPVSDVYALGAILYHLLTGRPPFLGASPQAILRAVVETEPLAPRRLNSTIPLDLETICFKCLEKEPARRYATAQELAEELGRFLSHEPLRARPVGWLGRSRRWSQRHPARAGLAAALAITFLTVAIVPTIAYFRIRRAEQARASQLRETLLTQARAVRLGGHSGQGRDSLAAVVEAARPVIIADVTDFLFRLRREAIASLAVDDAWFEADTNLPPRSDPTMLRFDTRQELFGVGESAGRVRLFGAADRQLQAELVFTNQSLQHVVDFSPDKRFLALRQGREIGIWDLVTGVKVLSEVAALNQFAFQRDGQAVAFLGSHGVSGLALPSGAKLWERPLGDFVGRGAIAFAPLGHWLAVGLGGGRGVELHDLQSAAVVRLQATEDITALAWSQDSRWLGVGGLNGSVRLWDLSGTLLDAGANAPPGEPIPPTWTFEALGAYVHALAFSPDGRWLAAAGDDETVRLIDVRAGSMGLVLAAVAFRLDFSPDSARVGPVWQSGRPGWLRLTNSSAFKLARFKSRGSNPALAINPAGDRCVAASSSEILVFNSRLEGWPLKLPFEYTRAAYFQPDGGLLALTFYSSAIWPVVSSTNGFGSRDDFLPGFGGDSAAFSPDRRMVVFANYQGDSVDLIHDGRLRHRLAHPRAICVALHPNGRDLVSTSLDGGETRLWNAETGQLVKTWPDEGGNRIAFSPDGQCLAQFGPRCVVRDTKTWQARSLLGNVPPNASDADAAFSPDGRWLAVIMADRELHLLRTRDFATLAVLEAPSNARLHRLAWNANGEKLAVLARQNELQIWDLRKLRTRLQALRADWPE